MRQTLQVPALLGWIALSAVAGVIGGIASIDAASFYQQLVRPSWAPPSWVFGPVWTLLYLLMGIAAWLVWRERWRKDARASLALFVVQLALNALWSWLFFAWHRGAWAFADVVVLGVVVCAMMVAFVRVRPLAGALMVPYLAWLTFAGVLNFVVWQLNPAALGL